MRPLLLLLLLFHPLAAEELAKPLNFDSLNYLSLSKENRAIALEATRSEEKQLQQWLKPYSLQYWLALIALWCAIPLLYTLYIMLQNRQRAPAPTHQALSIRPRLQEKSAALLDEQIQTVRRRLEETVPHGAPSMTHEELLSSLKTRGVDENLLGRVSTLLKMSELSLYAKQPVNEKICKQASKLSKEIFDRFTPS